MAQLVEVSTLPLADKDNDGYILIEKLGVLYKMKIQDFNRALWTDTGTITTKAQQAKKVVDIMKHGFWNQIITRNEQGIAYPVGCIIFAVNGLNPSVNLLSGAVWSKLNARYFITKNTYDSAFNNDRMPKTEIQVNGLFNTAPNTTQVDNYSTGVFESTSLLEFQRMNATGTVDWRQDIYYNNYDVQGTPYYKQLPSSQVWMLSVCLSAWVRVS